MTQILDDVGSVLLDDAGDELADDAGEVVFAPGVVLVAFASPIGQALAADDTGDALLDDAGEQIVIDVLAYGDVGGDAQPVAAAELPSGGWTAEPQLSQPRSLPAFAPGAIVQCRAEVMAGRARAASFAVGMTGAAARARGAVIEFRTEVFAGRAVAIRNLEDTEMLLILAEAA